MIPTVVQLENSTGSWMPANLANARSGTVDDVSVPAAVAALVAWGLVPACAGLVSVIRRDVI